MTEEFKITWEDPPVYKPGRGRKAWWFDLLPKVAGRPGYWACLRTYEGNKTSTARAHQTAYQLRRKNKLGQLPEGTWEFRAVTNEKESKLYARFTEGTNGTEPV